MSQCCDSDLRRAHLHAARDWNGLDYVEVADSQLELCAYFFGRLPPELANPAKDITRHLRLSGGRRIRDIRILAATPMPAEREDEDDRLFVSLSGYGDFSAYTLHLVDVAGIDQRYASVEFSFKASCPSDIDCGQCPPQASAHVPGPLLNYLAKDYASFRQLLLDRMALLMPDWQERHVPDLGITLVEVLAYAADQLSYYQDAVATEAYLQTARQRISVRRHARVVDYHLHEGCNARAWVCLGTDTDLTLPLTGTAFLTGLNEALQNKPNPLLWRDVQDIPASQYTVFEAVWPWQAGSLPLYQAHNAMQIYTWGEQFCSLAQGSVEATLLDAWVDGSTRPEARALHLQVGDVLIFEAVASARTGLAADADPRLRHAVRLTSVRQNIDPLLALPDGRPTPVLDIGWSVQDALPFCLPLSSLDPECKLASPLALARGNVLLVDHGRSLTCDLGQVGAAQIASDCLCQDRPGEVRIVPAPFRPTLPDTPLTHAEPLPQDPPIALGDADDSHPHGPHSPHQPHHHPRHRKHGHHGHHRPHTIPAAHSSQSASAATAIVTDDSFPGATDTPATPPAHLVPASGFLLRDARHALPTITLSSQNDTWEARYDLIESQSWDTHFVVETDNAGHAHLRFGDGELGRQPEAGEQFAARYRIGNGPAGNVGAEAISHLVLAERLSGARISVRNPLPATGGQAAESMMEAKLAAPHAFRQRIERAIIAEDYQTIAERNLALQRAACELVWSGSWNEAVVSIDPLGSEQADPALLRELDRQLQHVRRMGHDLRIKPAQYVPIELELAVCVLPGYQSAHVLAALRQVFGNGLMPDGRPGFFHPDRLSFGQGIYISQLVAVGQAQAGVECVSVTRLQRQFHAANGELANGLLPLQSWEIARLDNDPNFPEHGKLVIRIHGGR